MLLIQFSVALFAVGKTSLITRFMYDSFDNTYQVSQTEILVQCPNSRLTNGECLLCRQR